MIRPLLLAPVLFLNTALAAEQTFISCDFTTLNRANALPPYLQLDNSGSRPSTINIIPDAEVAGNAIARMILQPGDDRQEFVFMRPGETSSSLKHHYGGELWVGFRMRVENLLDSSVAGNSASLFQFGPVSNSITSNPGGGLFQVMLSRSRGLLSLRSFRPEDGSTPRFSGDVAYPDFLDFFPEPQGRWVALTSQLRLRNDGGGLLRIWADGKLVADMRGPNALPGDWIQVKWGTYIGINSNIPDRLTVDYDDIAMLEPITGTNDGFRMVSVAVPVRYVPNRSFTKALIPPPGVVTAGRTWATSSLPDGMSFSTATKSITGTPGPTANGHRIAWWLTDSSGVRHYQQVLRLVDSTSPPSVLPLATPEAPSVNNPTSSTPTLSGTTEVYGNVKIYDNLTLLGNVTASATGAWTWRVSPALSQGDHDLRVTVTDDTNRTSPLSPVTRITVPDTTRPIRPFAPTTSSATSATPVLSGTTEANATVMIYDNGDLVRTVTANANGVWSWTVTPALAQGSIHAFSVSATDLANNTSYTSLTTTVRVPDRTPPITPGAPDASSTTSATPVLSGITEANARVKIYDDGILRTTVAASAIGAWTWTVNPALAPGPHAFRITATDAARNSSAVSLETIINVPDSTSPSRPPAPTASSTSSANPVLSGVTEANATITIFHGGNLRATVRAGPTGAWSWTVRPSLAVGPHVFTVTATDGANNTSALSPSRTINVPAGIVADSTRPTTPTLPSVSSTTSPTPVVSGSTEANATISLFDNGQLIATIPVDSSGAWSWTVSPAFVLGHHPLTVIATDGAGNASITSLVTTVTVSDTTAPATPLAPVVNSLTDDTPTLSGTTEANATVTIFHGATPFQTVMANGVGDWSWTVVPALTQGVHLLAVTSTDAASNVSGLSLAATITVPDITPPTKPGMPSASSLTSATPVLSGTAEAHAIVTIYDNVTELNRVTANAEGAWSWTVTPPLAQGCHDLQVSATDAKGNTSVLSSAITINVPDTTPPVTPTAPAVTNPFGDTPTLSGTAEANAMVTIYEQETPRHTVIASTTGIWSWTVAPAMTLGVPASFRVTATDLAGNVSGHSAATAVTIQDLRPPTRPHTPTASSLSSANPVLSGTTEANARIRIFHGGTLRTTVTASPTGAWSWTVSPRLAVGVHVFTVTAMDVANNTSEVSLSRTITVPTGIVADSTLPTRPARPTVSSTTSPTPEVSGRTEANATISLLDNGKLIKTIPVDTRGDWSWTVSPAFALGSHNLTVIATDGAGNASMASLATTVTVSDTTPPAQPQPPAVNRWTDNTPTLSGTTEANAIVKIYDGATPLNTVVANSAGDWTWTVAPALAPGDHALKITATDAANNTSAFSEVITIIVRDTTPPTTPLAPDASNRFSATPVLSGTTEPNATVKIYDNGTLVKTVTANGSGAWTWTVTPALAQGSSHSYRITATDAANNISALSNPTTVNVPDTTPPLTPNAPSANSLTSATPVLSGATEPNATVKIYDNGTLVRTVVATASGAWTWTVTPALAQGSSHSYRITASDVANNTSALSDPTTVNVPDTTPPITPSAPSASNLTSATPVLSGATEPNATVKIYDNGTLVKTLPANGSGIWTWTVTPALAQGSSHGFRITATDGSNNTSALSNVTTVNVPDTTPPITPDPPNISSLTSPNPVLSGTTEANATIKILVDSIVRTTVTAGPRGAWTWTVVPSLTEGTHAIAVIAIDTALNASLPSSPIVVTVGPSAMTDTTPPTKPTAPTVSSDTSPTPVVSGSTEVGATITIFDDGLPINTITVTSTGSWSWTVSPAFALGSHPLTVMATDVAGNASEVSAATTVTVRDLTPPPIPLAPAANSFTDDTPTLSGTTEADATVSIFHGATLLHTVMADGVGNWTWTVAPALGQGEHFLTVIATDLASNVSGRSPETKITVPDLTPPAQPATPTATNLSSVRPTLSGFAEANATILINEGGSVIGTVTATGTGTWTWTPEEPLTEGIHTLTVVAKDAGNNISPESDAVVITIHDRTPPLTPAAPIADSITSANPTLTGASEPNATIQVRINGSVVKNLAADGTGDWTWTVTPALDHGVHVVTVTATDGAGNVSAVSDATTIDVPDTTPPVVPGPPDVRDGTTPNPIFSGSTEPGATITVYEGLTSLASVTAGSDGRWSMTIESTFSPGRHVITVTAQDSAGNTSAASPPAIFTVADITLEIPKARTPEATGVTTVTPTLVGTRDPGTRIQIFNGSTQIGSVPTNGTGQWQWTPSTPLAVGTHELTVVEVDSLGVASRPSDAIVVRVTPSPETSPVVNPVADGASGGCGVGGSVAMLLGGLLALGSRRRHPKNRSRCEAGTR